MVAVGWVVLLVGVPMAWGLIKWSHKGAVITSMIVFGIFWLLVLALLERAGRSDVNPKRSKVWIRRHQHWRERPRVDQQDCGLRVDIRLCIRAGNPDKYGNLRLPEPNQAFHTGSNWDAYLLMLGGPSPRLSSRRGSSLTRRSKMASPTWTIFRVRRRDVLAA